MSDIDRDAVIGEGNRFGAHVVIGPDVRIGENNAFGDFVSIRGRVAIGDNNRFSSGCVIGGVSNAALRERPSLADDAGAIHIGNENLFGEFVTVHAPSARRTTVANRVNVGAHAHVAHDAVVESGAIIAVHAVLGGYVRVLQHANVGLGARIHPRLIIGQYALAGMGAILLHHVHPGAIVVGSPARYLKPNLIGMRRGGLSELTQRSLCSALAGRGGGEDKDAALILERFFEVHGTGDFIREKAILPTL